MNVLIGKEELEEFVAIKGEVRGVSLKTQADFILQKEGKESYERLEKEMEELGFSLRGMKPMSFYPLRWEGIMLLLIKRLFNYSDEDFVEMGKSEAKVSFIIRLFMKLFVSIDRVVKEVPSMWREYYTVGKLTVVDLNKKERSLILKLENFPLYSIQRNNLKGYFSSVLQMIVGVKTNCEEKDCYKGEEDCHKFLLTW